MGKKVLLLALVLFAAMVFGVSSVFAYYGGSYYYHTESKTPYNNYQKTVYSNPYEYKVVEKKSTYDYYSSHGKYRSYDHYYKPSYNYYQKPHYQYYRINYGHGSYGYLDNKAAKYWREGYHPPQYMQSTTTYRYY